VVPSVRPVTAGGVRRMSQPEHPHTHEEGSVEDHDQQGLRAKLLVPVDV
jgi:hypothetical protein